MMTPKRRGRHTRIGMAYQWATATIPSNHFDSTNVRCWTSPARLVPESTVLRRASSSLRPASFLRIPVRWSSSVANSCLTSAVTWLMAAVSLSHLGGFNARRKLHTPDSEELGQFRIIGLHVANSKRYTQLSVGALVGRRSGDTERSNLSVGTCTAPPLVGRSCRPLIGRSGCRHHDD